MNIPLGGHSIISKEKILALFLLVILTLSAVSGSTMSFGHNFSTNESASFIGLVDLIKTQAQLIQENIASNNISLASEHADDALALVTDNVTKEIAERNQRLADELGTTLTSLKTASETISDNATSASVEQIVSDLDAILEETLTARIDADVLDNSTIRALAMLDILDGILNGYGDAYAVGFDMTNMSMMMGPDGTHSMDMTGGGDDGIQSMGSMDMGSGNMSSDQGSKLVSVADYQTAQALAVKAQEIFDEQLSNNSSNTQSLNNIKSALQELVDTINNKGTPMDVMIIVHSKIHPNFITAYGLQLT
jgi:hypothetical protein